MLFADHFLSTPEGRFFVAIDHEFLSNRFNHYGLTEQFDDYDRVYEYVTKEMIDFDEDSPLYRAAVRLYGLVHARFILTRPGFKKMASKYSRDIHLPCPRVNCKKSHCLPYGESEVEDIPTRIYCPNCTDVYKTKDPILERISGVYFGPTYVHLLEQTYPSFVPPEPPVAYVPKIFGMKVYHGEVDDGEYDEEEDIASEEETA